ncbi:hypothetical protein [Brevibacillus composti]|nr:hypothetical protein [Brevibacillus composti]
MSGKVSMARSLFAFLFAMALAVPIQPSASAEEAGWDERFRTQVGEWKNTIVAQDPQFKEWRDAQIEVQTLGTNQHQWLISLSRGSKQVGYMVIGEVMPTDTAAAPPQFVLLEYGLGEYILFDDTFAPREIAAEPVYDGFASHWLVSLPQHGKQVIDAKTGERYLSTTQAEEPVMSSLREQDLAVPGQQLTATRIVRSEETHPFDDISWFVPLVRAAEESPRLSWEDLWQRDTDKMTVAVRLYHSEVLSPFSVGSLHVWNHHKPYVGVWDEGLRFLPYAYVQKVGKFHSQ